MSKIVITLILGFVLRKAIEDQLKEIKTMPVALLRKAFNGGL